VTVPEGFIGSSLPVPRPSGSVLYLKLRDAPQIVNPLRLSARQAAAEPGAAADGSSSAPGS
jgi:hypothetical protein